MYRIIQEAVNNAVKYAQAKQIIVHLKEENSVLFFNITDDGKGFSVAEVHLGNGLNNMQKRASEIGAEIIIDSKENQGTTVLIKYPI